MHLYAQNADHCIRSEPFRVSPDTNNSANVSNSIDKYCSGDTELYPFDNEGDKRVHSEELTDATSSQASILDDARRHNSMDRLMNLLSDMGQSPRARSLSDGGHEESECL